MKKVLKSSLSLALALTIVLSSALVELGEIDFSGLFAVKASAASESDLTFTLNDDSESYCVTDCNYYVSGELVIPSTYNGLPVTSIGDWAFYICTSLTSVTIPNSVTSIGYSAFYSCDSLTSITIPDSVTSIGVYAFGSCRSLTSVTIPNSVTSIGDRAFYDCTSLTSVTIPDSVTSIGAYAFYECERLASVIIGNGVTSIGEGAFYYCESLISINVDANNKNYSSVNGVLFNKDKTVLIQYPIGKNNTEYSIPDSVTSIGDDAFSWCRSLTLVIIPNSVTDIDYVAFRNCTSLTSITIPNSVTSIGDSAFWNCTSLTSVTIGNSVTSIGDSAFLWCESLTSVTIPDGVTSIGSYVFKGCTNLTSINVDENNKNYSSINGVLFNKDKTVLIRYPEGKTDTKYTIPDGVTSIGEGAFEYCTSLTSITIPNSVTSIGDSAFYDCACLKYVLYASTEADWANIAIGTGNTYLTEASIHYNSTDHTYSTEWTIDVEATCTTAGSKSHHCTVCGDKTDITEIESLGHSYGDWVTISEPTCTEEGTKNKTCSACGDVVTEAIAIIDHTYSTEWTIDVEATCTTAGSKSHHCTVCGDKTDITEIETLGHSYGDWVVTKEPTCTEEGTKNKTCSACGDVVTEAIAIIDHTYSTEWTIDVEATCTTAGSKSHHCTVCGDKTDITEIETLGHSYGDWVVTKEPTCTEEGSKNKTCSACGDVVNEVIDANGHSYGDLLVTLAPTCTEDGEGYKECDTCGYEEWESVDKTGHTFGEWEVVRTSCLEDGYSRRVCSCCGAVQTKDKDGKIILDGAYITYDSVPSGYMVSVEYPGAESIEITFGNISGYNNILFIFDEDGTYQQVDAYSYSYSTHTFTGGYVVFAVSTFSSYSIEIESAFVYEKPEENLEATGHNYVLESYDSAHPHTKVYKCSYCGETKTETPVISDCLECNFTFTALDVSSYKVVSYTGTGSAAVVPGKYNNCTVTTIANGCFKGNTNITSVEIGSGVTTIGSLAFMNCANLEKVIIPASVTSIGANAFYGFTGTIYCFSGSTAHQYAIDNNIPYVLMSFSGKGTTKVDYVDLLVRTSVQCCDDLTELFEMSDSVLAVPMASYVYGNFEYYGTGTIVTVFDGDDYIGDFTIVVEGDTNGDSVCDVLDCAAVQVVSSGHGTLAGVYSMAADSDSDGIVDVNDYQSIVNKAVS